MSKNNFGEDLYNGAAITGTFLACGKAVVTTIIIFFFVSLAIYLIKNPTEYSKTTDAIIITATCSSYPNKNDTLYSCDLTLNYSVNNVGYNTNLRTSGSDNYANQIGKKISIDYNPNNPNDIILSRLSNRTIGIGILIVSLLVLAGSWFWCWLTTKYKMAGAISTGDTLLNAVAR